MSQLSQDDLPLDDNAFLELLGVPDLQRQYEQGLSEINQQASKEFDEGDSFVAMKKTKSEELKKDQDHQNLVNCCIYPFSQKGSLRELGYYLIRTEPLYEKGEEDLDFLIASSSKRTAIFGETKTSTVNSEKIVTQGKKRRDLILSKEKEIKETHVPNVDKLEFVFGVPALEARDLSAKILEKQNSKFIIWMEGSPDSNNHMLSMFVPPGIHGPALDGLIHADAELNSRINRLPTSAKCKLFSPRSHPVTKLQVFAWMDQDAEGEETSSRETFKVEDVRRFLSVELENYPDDIIDNEVKKLMTIALEIGIIKELGNENYRLGFTHSDPAARYEDTKEKWMSFSIERDKQAFILKERVKLQNKLRETRSAKVPPLVPFDDDTFTNN